MRHSHLYAYTVLAMLGEGVRAYDGQEVLVVLDGPNVTDPKARTWTPPRLMWMGPPAEDVPPWGTPVPGGWVES